MEFYSDIGPIASGANVDIQPASIYIIIINDAGITENTCSVNAYDGTDTVLLSLRCLRVGFSGGSIAQWFNPRIPIDNSVYLRITNNAGSASVYMMQGLVTL